jgi:hypothetical protein
MCQVLLEWGQNLFPFPNSHQKEQIYKIGNGGKFRLKEMWSYVWRKSHVWVDRRRHSGSPQQPLALAVGNSA